MSDPPPHLKRLNCAQEADGEDPLGRPAQYFAGVETLNLYKRAIRAVALRGNSRCDRPGRHPGSAAFQNDEAGFGRAQI